MIGKIYNAAPALSLASPISEEKANNAKIIIVKSITGLHSVHRMFNAPEKAPAYHNGGNPMFRFAKASEMPVTSGMALPCIETHLNSAAKQKTAAVPTSVQTPAGDAARSRMAMQQPVLLTSTSRVDTPLAASMHVGQQVKAVLGADAALLRSPLGQHVVASPARNDAHVGIEPAPYQFDVLRRETKSPDVVSEVAMGGMAAQEIQHAAAMVLKLPDLAVHSEAALQRHSATVDSIAALPAEAEKIDSTKAIANWVATSPVATKLLKNSFAWLSFEKFFKQTWFTKLGGG